MIDGGLIFPRCGLDVYPLLAPELAHIKDFTFLNAPSKDLPLDGILLALLPRLTDISEVHLCDSQIVIRWGDRRKLTYIGNCDINDFMVRKTDTYDYEAIDHIECGDALCKYASFATCAIMDPIPHVAIYNHGDDWCIESPHVDDPTLDHFRWNGSSMECAPGIWDGENETESDYE